MLFAVQYTVESRERRFNVRFMSQIEVRTLLSLTTRNSRKTQQTYTGSILVAVNPYKEIDCFTKVRISDRNDDRVIF